MTSRGLPLDASAHKVADALLPWLVNGTLDSDEAAFVRRHVDECARCQSEVRWLRELQAACAECATKPDGSDAMRKLRRHLEDPSPANRPAAASPAVRARPTPWSRRVIAAQFALIAALGTVALTGDGAFTRYRTLGAGNAVSPAAGALVVIFDPTTTESELRRIVRRADARVVDGPTRTNAYVLDVPAERRKASMQALRSERAVTFVESLGATDTR